MAYAVYALNIFNKEMNKLSKDHRSKIEKIFPQLKENPYVGDQIILYVVAPDRELIGEFTIGGILIGTPNELWEKTKDDICYKKEEIIPYLESGNFPIAFRASNPRIYDSPVSINKIPLFRPQMSYCEASAELLTILHEEKHK